MVVVSLSGGGRNLVPREGHCCAVPVKRSRSDQRRERKPNWPCRELLALAYSQLQPLSCSSFGDRRTGNPVACGVELRSDPGKVLPVNHESATNLHGIFKFIGSEA